MATRPGLIDAALRPHERLKLSERFVAIRRQGRWVRGELLSVGVLPNALASNRVGIRVRRGVSGSVVRNRAKRVFRAIYQHFKGRLLVGFDLVVVLNGVAEPREALERDLVRACQRLGLLAKQNEP